MAELGCHWRTDQVWVGAVMGDLCTHTRERINSFSSAVATTSSLNI